MEALSGYYNTEQRSYDLSINHSENISEKQIERICIHIIAEGIQNLTLEFVDGNFIFFTKKKEKIRFVEGPLSELIFLQKKAKKDLDGEIAHQEIGRGLELVTTTSTSSDLDFNNSTLDEKARIQHSLFSSLDQFKKVFSNAEIYFEPYEDPGGDFYWIKRYPNHSLVVVGDCTGHGLEGALISMSVMTLLKQFFKSLPESMEHSIYDFYDQFKSLMEDEDFDAFDTELGFVLLDNQTHKMSYIGSGVNLIVKTSKSTNIHTTRKSKIVKKEQTILELPLERGDQLFLFSDGIQDQFDNMNTRKLGTRGLLHMLEELDRVTLENFTQVYDTFRGSTEPLDDQTLLMLTI